MDVLALRCPACDATVRLQPAQIVLLVPLTSEEERPAGQALYSCERCAGPVVQQAPRPLVALLIGAGVTLLRVDGTSRPAHPEEPDPQAPPLTPDDVLDLHELLAGEEWLARLHSAG